jgi:DNA invertase Pin-like site-specific DNA recombinase
MSEGNSTPLRTAGYCRTSGEGQRDNTSIPRQKEAIAAFCKAQGWRPPEFYVDECRSGAKVDGRAAFQEMVRDATAGKLDVLVPFDATRFARDGCDIVSTAKVLRGFGVYVVDAKGQFDNRDHRNALRNFVSAGVSEHERLTIMERMIGGRVQMAKEGKQWSSSLPVGREYVRVGPKPKGKDTRDGKWAVSEHGRRLAELLARYADGEGTGEKLAKEHGYAYWVNVLRHIHEGQLAADPYVATFNAPEIGIVNLKVPVPAVPPVISPELERRVLDRLAHNRTWNKQHLKFLLTGFLRCADCGKALTGQTQVGGPRYKHSKLVGTGGKDCSFQTVMCRLIDGPVLTFLYRWFVDQPAFDLAVKLALPPAGEREAKGRELAAAGKDLDAVKKKIGNLIRRMEDGADGELLSERLAELKAERDAQRKRLEALERELEALPDPKAVLAEAEVVRARLAREHAGKDWRGESYEDIRRFLHSLFSDNPGRNNLGVYLRRGPGGGWSAEVRARLFLRSPERLDLGDQYVRFVGGTEGEEEDITAFRRVNLSSPTDERQADHTLGGQRLDPPPRLLVGGVALAHLARLRDRLNDEHGSPPLSAEASERGRAGQSRFQAAFAPRRGPV